MKQNLKIEKKNMLPEDTSTKKNLSRKPIKRCRPPKKDEESSHSSSREDADVEKEDEETCDPESREKVLYPGKWLNLKDRLNIFIHKPIHIFNTYFHNFTVKRDLRRKKISEYLKRFRLYICISSIIVIILSILCYRIFVFYNSGSNSVDQIIENLVSKYQNGKESPLTKRIILSALKDVLVSEPPKPAVITVLANPGTSSDAIQFCENLAKSLVPRKYIMIDQHIYGEGSEGHIKMEIDYSISREYDDSSLNAVIVDQVQKIPLHAMGIFHNLCDDSYPRFKRVIYMFILTLNEGLNKDVSIREIDEAAIEQFTNIWKHALPDEYNSLITRLTVNVINFR